MKIRSDILRVYQSLHTWVGITAGILLFIGFFAGALTMFKQPLERWISPPAHMLNPVKQNQLDTLVRDVLAKHPAAREEFSLHLAQRENVTAPMSWNEGDSGRELDLSGKRWQATLDDNNNLLAEKIAPSLLAELIDMLHRTAGIPGFIDGEYMGVYIMGIAGVMYFLALVSGVILLLPTLVKDFLALRPGKNRKRFWLDAHNIIGIASLPYHIVISLTVIVFAFHDQFYGALSNIVYRDEPMFARPAAPAEPYDLQQLLPITNLINRVQIETDSMDFVVDELLFMGLDTPRPRVRAAVISPRYILQGPQAGYVIIHPFTGEILDTSMLPTKADSWGESTSTFFALHFGSYGGETIRWVYFLLGLSGAFLFYSGNLLWVESRRKKQRQQHTSVTQPLNIRLMASVSVGVCLGSIIGVCITMIAGKWFAGHDHLNFIYLATYYGVFLLAVSWAFLRGAAKASLDLLIASALAAFAIPLTSLLAMFIPNLWVHTSSAALGVDLTAFAIGLLFIIAAYFTAQRIKHGPTDSVWSAKNSTVVAQLPEEELA